MKPIKVEDVGAFISKRFLNGREISTDEDLLLTGQIDSLGIVVLVAHLEEMTGARIPPQDITLENFATISSIADYVNNA